MAGLGPLAVPSSAATTCPVYDHHQATSPDGQYYVAWDTIACRDANGSRVEEILLVTQGDPSDANHTVVLRLDHAWLRSGSDAWASSTNVRQGELNVTAGATDPSAGAIGACAASIVLKDGAASASVTTPGVACPPPSVFPI